MKKKKGAAIETSKVPADSERKIFVATSDASLNSYSWDQKLQYAPNILHICCPFQSTLPPNQVIEALRDNSTIQSITFVNWMWEQKELNELVECLTEYNRSVNKIEFDRMTFTSNITEAWVKILKRNPRIETVKLNRYYDGIPEEFFARFCDGLEYYNIKSLELDTIKSTQQFQILSENLKYNHSLTELSLKDQQLSHKLFGEICNALLASPTISSFRFTARNNEDFTKDDYNALSAVIKSNKLKHLTLTMYRINFQHLELALKNNTSIQSLDFLTNETDYKVLGDIIATNRNIKKLNLNRSVMTENSILDLQLSKNTSLEEFSLISIGSVNGRSLFNQLKANSTLKSLTFGHSLVFDVIGLQELLKVNTSLTELNLTGEYFEDRLCCTYIANGLIENTTLRKLTCNLTKHEHEPAMKFIQQMKLNSGLTHLSMGPDLMRIGIQNRYGANEFARVDQLALDLVTTNKNLRYLEGADKFPHIAEQLKKNRQEQDLIITNACTLVKMILMKPNSFILPMEVWSNIFKHVSCSFVPFDFVKFFKDSMA